MLKKLSKKMVNTVSLSTFKHGSVLKKCKNFINKS